ncbi:hypothetical protein MUK42_20348, partial [Musa troglodytarum]
FSFCQHPRRLEGDVRGAPPWGEERGGGGRRKGAADQRRAAQGGGEERQVAPMERRGGKGLRRFRLPENATVDQVKASMDNDVLSD